MISSRIEENDRALVTLVPHTTSTRGTQFEADPRTHFLKPGAFDAQGLVTVPVSRAIRPLGSLKDEQMGVVEVAVCRWLGLPCHP